MAVILNASTSSGLVQTADTSGQLELQSNGSTKLTVSSTGVSGTLIQGTAVASTSGTSIDFTGIPSWVKRVTVMFNGVSTNSTSPLQIQLGNSGGIESTSYASSSSVIATGVATATATSGFVLTVSTTYTEAAEALRGSATITNLSGNTWCYSGVFSTNTYQYPSSGVKELSATLDRIRITTVNGTDTFDDGTINIQYEG